jgi:hypothetical protein
VDWFLCGSLGAQERLTIPGKIQIYLKIAENHKNLKTAGKIHKKRKKNLIKNIEINSYNMNIGRSEF